MELTRYEGSLPLCGDIDEADLATFRQVAVEAWHSNLAAAGGRPAEEPTVEQVANPFYGSVVTGESGDAVLTEDGRPVCDQVKYRLLVTGRAYGPTAGAS